MQAAAVQPGCGRVRVEALPASLGKWVAWGMGDGGWGGGWLDAGSSVWPGCKGARKCKPECLCVRMKLTRPAAYHSQHWSGQHRHGMTVADVVLCWCV
jgi:hypothetical protein